MAQFSATIDLSSLDGSNGFRLDGSQAFSYSGRSVSSAGDINGDGFDDIIIGASRYTVAGTLQAGESYVVFGKDTGFSNAIDLVSLDGTDGFKIDGDSFDDQTGWSVSSAGDINGDGFDDIIIGAVYADSSGGYNSGESYVIFGKTGGFSSTLGLDSLDGTDGFNLEGISVGDQSGRSVSSAGDINGDGFDDIIIGATGADTAGGGPNAGESYVVFGHAGGFSASVALSGLDGTNGFRIDGTGTSDGLGISVSSAGDFNGDGFDDFLIGAFRADVGAIGGGGGNAGETYVVFGSAAAFSTSFSPSVLDGSNGFTLQGVAGNDYSGRTVSSAGDVNGDGFDDIIIGAYRALSGSNFFAGQSYVVFGKAAGFAGTMSLSTLDGTNGFSIGGLGSYDYSGRSVSSAGDVNGDGFDDIIIGAPQTNINGADDGQSYVVFGKAGGFTSTFDLATLDGSNGFNLNGVSLYDVSGLSVSSAGDVNGDGFADVMVGAFRADPGGTSNAGESYVVFGVKETAVALNLVGAGGDQTMLGGILGDTISGLGGDDVLRGFAGDDTLNGDDGEDTLLGGRGFDVLNGGNNDDRLYGSTGDDEINGDNGDDFIKGNNDDDLVSGGKGDDLIYGGDGDDEISGNTGSDRIFGGDGDDIIEGNRGNDRLRGGAGDDELFGLRNNDHIRGGAGADILDGGAGKDWLFGEAGADTFVFSLGYQTDFIEDWEIGVDFVDLTGFGFSDFNTDVLANTAQSGADLVLTFGADILTIKSFLLADFDAGDVLL